MGKKTVEIYRLKVITDLLTGEIQEERKKIDAEWYIDKKSFDEIEASVNSSRKERSRFAIIYSDGMHEMRTLVPDRVFNVVLFLVTCGYLGKDNYVKSDPFLTTKANSKDIAAAYGVSYDRMRQYLKLLMNANIIYRKSGNFVVNPRLAKTGKIDEKIYQMFENKKESYYKRKKTPQETIADID